MHESMALLQHRILFLSEEVTRQTANRIVGQLLLLDADDHQARIDLYINSPGGSVTDGMAIIDAMQCIQAPVATFCIGQAASMGSCILAAGTPGYRYATPNSEIMIHPVAASIQGPADDIQVRAERIQRMQERLAEMLAGWTGRSMEQLREDLSRDFFMSAQQAKEYGIIDAVIEPFDKRPGRS